MVIKQLVYLLALARERHFGLAAERSHISQPTLSAAIRQLEDELQVPIVERGNRFIGFTPEGERVLEYARRIVADCDALRQDLSEMRQGLTGHLRIGVVPSALPIVSRITGPFAVSHPRVSVTIMSLTSIEIQKQIDEFVLDVGLTYLDNEPVSRMRTLPLYREHYILLTPAGGPFAGRQSATWAEAASVPLCLLSPDMQNRRIVDKIFQSVGQTPQPTLETNSIVTLCLHVSAGQLSSVMPHTLLDMPGLPDGTIAVELTRPEVSYTLGFVMPDREPAQPLARALFALAPTLGLAEAMQWPLRQYG
ncbi:LysR family transcriptional regulator [Aliidongia dinghuensis]|uniref:LysR family transcriptional regulator n=1 Tax=Aliidongia dinghuensis TaxID=1867774 RepID=A0A8J3E3L0_9PROT|nr:LysR family transcriptional regulator [Aliidongia dinghuensis]GGF31223.1 LysR family transcriptional regulator [Aliidongia dinghuensis]